ncbi:MAG: DMT family transporter [Bdellovibrionaceae bacterium]|nr:DMT family transporter [Pseudobdellovibrionaceae bacterium]
MLAILTSVILFGLVHPISKVILDSGIPLSYFCISYVGIRFFIQLPLFVNSRAFGIPSKKIILPLIALGVCGAGLQFFEFKGINEGLSPGLVTFVMFSYPIWIVIGQSLFFNNASTLGSFLKVIAGSIGIYFVCRDHLDLQVKSWFSIVYPLLASIFIATWISLSNRLRKQGVPSLQLSLYYDLFSLLTLLVLLFPSLGQGWMTFYQWIVIPSNAISISLYSILIGLLPNLLFYFGSRTTSAIACAMAMALEPALSTMYSSIIWETSLSLSFFIGAIFILLANMPIQALIQHFKERYKDEEPRPLSSLEKI